MTIRQLRLLLWTAALIAVACFAVFRLQSPVPAETAQVAFQPKFALPDEAGTSRTSEEFRGKHLLVFFGFTSCPDVCPTTMLEVAEVMDALGPDAAKVQPLFISIDPERDRDFGLTEYVTAFHPSILGLAGDDATTRATAESFKIFYSREDTADGYTMSHSPALYLVGPEGDWLRQYSYGTPAAEILTDLKGRI